MGGSCVVLADKGRQFGLAAPPRAPHLDGSVSKCCRRSSTKPGASTSTLPRLRRLAMKAAATSALLRRRKELWLLNSERALSPASADEEGAGLAAIATPALPRP